MEIGSIKGMKFESPQKTDGGLSTVSGRFVKEKPEKIAKWVYNIIDWLRIGEIVGSGDTTVNNIHFQAKCFKYTHSGPLDLLDQGRQLYEAQIKVLETGSLFSVKDLCWSFSGMIAPVHDSATLWGMAVQELPKNLMTFLKKSNGIALTASMVRNLGNTGLEYACEKWVKDRDGRNVRKKTSADFRQHLLDIGAHASYLAIGVSIVGNTFFCLGIAGWVFTLLTTSTPFFSTMGYYTHTTSKVGFGQRESCRNSSIANDLILII